MIFSEDNWGRFEAMALVLMWVAVGSAAMILMMDGSRLIGHGFLALWNVIRSVIVAGGLIWLLPSALSGLREVSEILRLDHSPVPKQLMIAIVLLSLVMGAMAIVAHQAYLLGYFKSLGLPWAVMTAPVMSMAVLVSIAVSYAAAIAWFAIFPATAPDRNS